MIKMNKEFKRFNQSGKQKWGHVVLLIRSFQVEALSSKLNVKYIELMVKVLRTSLMISI
jgi:hypothetical protein